MFVLGRRLGMGHGAWGIGNRQNSWVNWFLASGWELMLEGSA